MPSPGLCAYGDCMTCGSRLSKQNNSGYCKSCWGIQLRDTSTYGGTRAEVIRLYPLDGEDCARCGIPAEERHHKDGDIYDNAPDNIEFLCKSCHTTQTLKNRWLDPEYRRRQTELNRRPRGKRAA